MVVLNRSFSSKLASLDMKAQAGNLFLALHGGCELGGVADIAPNGY